MIKDDIRLHEPCTASWSEMSGSEQKRFCGLCSKHVHDLSAMTEPEAAQVIQTVTSPCVRYSSNPDGTIRFRSSRRAFLSRAGMIAGGLMIGLSAAASVTPRETSAPASASALIAQLTDAFWAIFEDEPEPEQRLMGKPSIPSPVVEMGGLMPTPAPPPTMGRIRSPEAPPQPELGVLSPPSADE
jgi:hypothetical protein